MAFRGGGAEVSESDRGGLPPDDVERSAAQAEDMVQHLQEAMGRIGEVTGVGEAADGLVKATVTGEGNIKEVTFNPRVKRLDAQKLAEEVLVAVQAAQADAVSKSQKMVAEMIGGGGPFGKDFKADKLMAQMQQIEDDFTRSMGAHLEELERIRRRFE
jgi:DNA-binding protein YbaB